MGSERTTGRRVLVVEDDPGTRDLLVELLSGEGYEVRAAADGLEGIAAANGFRPDVIVLDLGLPRMDGRDFLVAYRAAAGPAAVVIVTGAIDAEAPLADVVLEKPFRIDHLLGEIAARPRGTSPRGSTTASAASTCSATARSSRSSTRSTPAGWTCRSTRPTGRCRSSARSGCARGRGRSTRGGSDRPRSGGSSARTQACCGSRARHHSAEQRPSARKAAPLEWLFDDLLRANGGCLLELLESCSSSTTAIPLRRSSPSESSSALPSGRACSGRSRYVERATRDGRPT